MENSETTDSLTISNTLARVFNDSLGPTNVKNFGAGGFFSSLELIKFQKLLREVPNDERPSTAVFYDGFNDTLFGFQYGPGRMQKDLAMKLKALVEHEHLRLGAYAVSELMGTHLVLWRRTGGRLSGSVLFPLGEPSRDPDDLDAAVSVYLANVRMTNATCGAFGISCFFVLQPLIVTKEPLSPLEREVVDQMEAHPRLGPAGVQFIRSFYRGVHQVLAGEGYFIDASDILDGRSESDFYDLGHVGALTPPVIGRDLALEIVRRLRRVGG